MFDHRTVRPLRCNRTVSNRDDRGIHVPDVEDDRFPAVFRGMSVQIEDSVAVGAEHPLILSAEAPKEIDDIEALCKQG